jgi:hypothetical protein
MASISVRIRLRVHWWVNPLVWLVAHVRPTPRAAHWVRDLVRRHGLTVWSEFG